MISIQMTTLLATLMLLISFGFSGPARSPQKPNIIIIYTDDMGVGDLSSYNQGWVQTPNIDRLAEEGSLFMNYYTASPVCSPSRAALMTGIFPSEIGINTYLHSRKGNANHEQVDFLDSSLPSMARLLKEVGYKTSHIGKWHLGGGRDVSDAPQITEYGFDEYVTTYEGPDPDVLLTASNWIWSEKDSIKRWERTGYFVDKTLDFLRRNQGSPVFVNLWPDDMHDPWIPDSAFYDKRNSWTGKANFVAVLKEYDRQIGRLLDGLERMGLTENTLIIFTSDNGAAPTFKQIRTNGQRGAKNSLFEGGIRMPFVVKWPGRIPKGRVDRQSVLSAVDLLPSLCALTGAKLPQGINFAGENMLGALLGNAQQRSTDLMWDFGRNTHFNRPADPYHRSPHLAIRRGDWKLLVNADGSEPLLYNIRIDGDETRNVAGEHPDLTAELSAKLIDWYREIGIPYLTKK